MAALIVWVEAIPIGRGVAARGKPRNDTGLDRSYGDILDKADNGVE